MIITNLINKIKSYLFFNNEKFLIILIIIGVSLGSFGLGRLSIENTTNKANNGNIDQFIGEYDDLTQYDEISNDNSSEVKHNFVASKNGKMYYTRDCSGVKRIKTENMIWFNTEEEAIKSGYSLSTLCK